ncbi:uncharacterized protein [Arachis hypogaea]|uniref:uncharacterized protein n=1 Tax=Arachis hypogaea TaxID=3818 RepID=UPI003B20E35A
MREQKLATMSEHPTIVLEIFKRIQQCFKLYYLLQGHVLTLAQRLDVQECSLVIRERPANQPQYSLPTASQVAAIIVSDDIETMVRGRGRDIKVQTHAGNLRRIQEFVAHYDPLQYPLLFPFGTHGWDMNTRTQSGNKASCRTYYSYMLQIRPDDYSTFLQVGRLLQQYVIDNYVKIETGKLRWVGQRQQKLRDELYQGLQDALHTGETNAENVGRRTILPSSFVGSRRDMTQRYEDGMTIVLKEGKPDIFLTMTCNPSWSEIASELSPTQTPHDRPDLTTRIFKAKFEQLKEDVITNGVLKKVKSYIYVTEFQKRGLSHVYMLLILGNNDKLSDPDQYDSLVRAKIPCKEAEPHLHEAVLRHMVHGPCGTLNQSSPCMKNGQCKRNYPKEFVAKTRQEICSSIKSIKYLYKYCYKGPDRVAMEVHRSSHYDEVKQSIDARWIARSRDVRRLWDEFLSYMIDDYPSTSTTTCHGLTNRLLRDLNDILLQHEKYIVQYDLPALTSDNDNDNLMPRIIQEEMSIEVPRDDLCSIERLNHNQSVAFRCIMNTIDWRESGVFFVDGPGGAGKTILYKAIIEYLRSKGHIALVTASSGIAATLLPGGRTAHSRFKIPINAEPSSMCNII